MLGAALVFGTRKVSRKLLDASIAAMSLMFGFSEVMSLDVALG